MIAALGIILMVCGAAYALHVKPSSPASHRMGSAVLAGTGALLTAADAVRPDLMPMALLALGVSVLWVVFARPELSWGHK